MLTLSKTSSNSVHNNGYLLVKEKSLWSLYGALYWSPSLDCHWQIDSKFNKGTASEPCVFMTIIIIIINILYTHVDTKIKKKIQI